MKYSERLFIGNFFLLTVVLSATIQLGSKPHKIEQAQAVEEVVVTPELVAAHVAGQPIAPEVPITEKEQIIAYIVGVFGEDAAEAITIVRACENKNFNPNAEKRK